MLKHAVYVGFAVLLGVAIMLLPAAMIGQLGSLMVNGQIQRETTKNSYSPPEAGDAAGFASSLPQAVLILILGLTAATSVFLYSKRRLTEAETPGLTVKTASKLRKW